MCVKPEVAGPYNVKLLIKCETYVVTRSTDQKAREFATPQYVNKRYQSILFWDDGRACMFGDASVTSTSFR